MNLWIKPSEFDPGIGGSELPINPLLRRVTPGFPCLGFLPQGLQIRNPPVQALAGEDTEFQFGDIEPTPVFGGVVNLQALRQAPGRFRIEGFVERTQLMGVKVIADQSDAVGLGILDLQEVLNLLRPVDGGPLRADVDLAVTLEGCGEHKDIRGAVTLIFIIFPWRLAGASG